MHLQEVHTNNKRVDFAWVHSADGFWGALSTMVFFFGERKKNIHTHTEISII